MSFVRITNLHGKNISNKNDCNTQGTGKAQDTNKGQWDAPIVGGSKAEWGCLAHSVSALLGPIHLHGCHLWSLRDSKPVRKHSSSKGVAKHSKYFALPLPRCMWEFEAMTCKSFSPWSPAKLMSHHLQSRPSWVTTSEGLAGMFHQLQLYMSFTTWWVTEPFIFHQVSLFPLSLLFDQKGHYPDHNSWSWSSTWTAIMTITRIVMMIFTWTVLWLYIPAILFDFKIMMLIFLWIIINPCYFSSPKNSLLNIKVAIMFTLLFIIFVITMTIRDMILHQKKTSLQTPSRLSSSWTPCS